MSEKYEAIKALDEALDKEIILYAGKFVENPNIKALEALCKLVTVDMYTDGYLEEHEGGEVAGTVMQGALGK